MFGKSVCLLAVLVTMAAIADAVPTPYYALTLTNDGSHNLIAGVRQKCDKLVLKQPAYQPGTSQFVQLKRTFYVGRWETITQASALDQDSGNRGAYPSIVDGGPGYNNVTILFKSQKGLSVNFIVELYAIPADSEDKDC